MDAHIPYSPPAPYGKLFPGRRSNLLPIEKFIEIRHDFLSGERELQEEERKHFVSQYDGSLAYIDANVDRVIKKLKELGRYENSLLIITSDHGEAFGEKGLLEHQVGTYENTTGVPLIIKYPAQTDGSEVSFPVSLVDVPTTVLDVAGLEPAQETDGRSLLEFSRGHRRPVFAELLACATTRDIDSRFAREEQAVVSQGWKLIRSDKMTSELYYLDEDPGETNNLLPREDEIRRTLDQTLDDWLSSAPKLGSESVEVDRDLRDRLRSLGYL